MAKKFLIFLSLFTCITSGCSKSGDKILSLSNINNFYGEKVDDNFLVGTTESIRNLMETNLGFILYIHSDDCSSCKNFAPIISEFSKNNSNLIVEVPISNVTQFYTDFKNDFFTSEELTLPYVGIIKGNKLTRINNNRYMKTKNAFTNYIHSKCHIKNTFYTEKNIETLSNSKRFTHISLKSNDETDKNLYTTVVLPLIEKTKNDVIITPNNTALEIADVGINYQVKEKIQITKETESSQISKFF